MKSYILFIKSFFLATNIVFLIIATLYAFVKLFSYMGISFAFIGILIMIVFASIVGLTVAIADEIDSR